MKILFGLLFILIITPTISSAQNNTSQYWKCTNRVGGEWNFGLAPSACDVDPFIKASRVEELYSPLIFMNDASDRPAERNRYMQEFYPVMRDFAEYYLKQRKNPSASEIKAWQKAVYTIAYQESFWSHYRNRDNAVKMMRGDFGHGHGIMQIDDRWHYAKVKDGVAANLIQNLVYALEIYYNAWQKAPSQSCVASSNSWISRTRSAYSAYNGGGSVYCRWTDPSHKWYRNDKNFYDKFKSEAWLRHVSDTNKKAGLNVECLVEEKPNCAIGGNNPNPSSLTEGQFYQTEKGKVCAYTNGQLHCIENSKDMACLNSFLGTKATQTISLSANVLSQYRWSAYDRHQLCVDNINSLIPIQNHVITQKPVTLLKESKMPLMDIPKGEKLLLKDFEVINKPGFPIYYKVNWESQSAYVAAGSHSSPEELFSVLANESDLKQLAQVGDIVEIKNSAGVNQRSSIKGQYIQNIPAGKQVEVLDRELQGTEGRAYFLISYKGKSGYIYGGQLNPNTVYKWTKLVQRKVDNPMASLKSNLWYVMPRECGSENCQKTGQALWSSKKYKADLNQSQFQVLEEKGDWIRIYSHNDNTHGWIKKEVTNEF